MRSVGEFLRDFGDAASDTDSQDSPPASRRAVSLKKTNKVPSVLTLSNRASTTSSTRELLRAVVIQQQLDAIAEEEKMGAEDDARALRAAQERIRLDMEDRAAKDRQSRTRKARELSDQLARVNLSGLGGSRASGGGSRVHAPVPLLPGLKPDQPPSTRDLVEKWASEITHDDVLGRHSEASVGLVDRTGLTEAQKISLSGLLGQLDPEARGMTEAERLRHYASVRPKGSSAEVDLVALRLQKIELEKLESIPDPLPPLPKTEQKTLDPFPGSADAHKGPGEPGLGRDNRSSRSRGLSASRTPRAPDGGGG